MDHMRRWSWSSLSFGLLLFGCTQTIEEQDTDVGDSITQAEAALRANSPIQTSPDAPNDDGARVYLRWEQDGPAFAYLEPGSLVEVGVKAGDWYCVTGRFPLIGVQSGWVHMSEVRKADSDNPNGGYHGHPCDNVAPARTSVLYWSCRVKEDGAGAPLLYTPEQSGKAIRILTAGQAVGLATDDECSARAPVNAHVWVAGNFNREKLGSCRNPTPGKGGWVLASQIVCDVPSACASRLAAADCDAAKSCEAKYSKPPLSNSGDVYSGCMAGLQCSGNQCVVSQPACGGPCPAGNQCVNNKCMPIPPCGGSCPAGNQCVDNKCTPIPPCGGSCPTGTQCINNMCTPIPACGGSCPAGYFCNGNSCQAHTCNITCCDRSTNTQTGGSSDGNQCVNYGKSQCGNLSWAGFDGTTWFGPRAIDCYAFCKNFTIYHRISNVASDCRGEAVKYCNSHGGFVDAKWDCDP